MLEILLRKRTRPVRIVARFLESSRTIANGRTCKKTKPFFIDAPRYSVATKRNSREANYSRESSSTCDTCSSIFLRLSSLSLFLSCVARLRFFFSSLRPPMEASRGLAKSRPDWSSAEASRSGRFGVLKARRVTCVISFATNATECKREKWCEVSTCT